MSKNIIQSKKGKIYSVISAIGGIMAISSITLLIIFNQFDIFKKNNNLKDSFKNSKGQKQIIQEPLQYSKIQNIIEEFNKFSNQHQRDSLKPFLSDTLERFFLRTRVTKQSVLDHLKWYWKTYPNIYVEYNFSEISIKSIEDSSYQVIIPGTHHRGDRTIDILSYIKINKNYKIIYLRDYNSE